MMISPGSRPLPFHYRKIIEFLDRPATRLYNLSMRRLGQWIFSEQGDMKEPIKLGLWVIALFIVGVSLLWFFSHSKKRCRTLAPAPLPGGRRGPFCRHGGLFHSRNKVVQCPPRRTPFAKTIQNIVQTLSKLLDPRSLNEGDHYEVRHGASGELP